MRTEEITIEGRGRDCARECLMALCELIGLILVAVMTGEPGGFVHVYFAATNFYTLVSDNLGDGVRYIATTAIGVFSRGA